LSVTSGELVLNRTSFQIKNAKARMPSVPNLAWQNIQAQIPDMGAAPQVELSADGRAPLGEWLQVVTRTPLGALTGQVFDSAQGSGLADLRLAFTLPLAAPERVRVQGRMVLPGNDLQWSSWTPAMSRLRATLQFTETSLSVTDAQARVWGGDTTLGPALQHPRSGGRFALELAGARGHHRRGHARCARLAWLGALGPLFARSQQLQLQPGFAPRPTRVATHQQFARPGDRFARALG
jgi:uncharacterized protein YhdP